MKKVKLPHPVTLILGSLGAFWIAEIINPGFNPVGIMILVLIPVLIADFLYPEPKLDLSLFLQQAPIDAEPDTISEQQVETDLLNSNESSDNENSDK